MIILFAIILVFITPIAILIAARRQVQTGYLWLMALVSSLAVWALAFVARINLPLRIILMRWEPAALFSTTPTLLIDEISWVYATALAAFPLAILLTDVIRVDEIDPDAWASSLGIVGLGIVAVMAGNPLTLMLAWMVMDFSETIMLLQRVPTSRQRERVIVSFSVKLFGTMLVLLAALVASAQGVVLTFENIPAFVSGILLLAAGLRLGVLPPHQPFFQEPPLRRGLGTIVRLAPVASSLMLLARVAVVGELVRWEIYLLPLGVLAAVYGGFAWTQAKDELDGRPYWILGMATFSLVSAVRGMPDASMAWGLAAILGGGVIFLTSVRTRHILIFTLLGLVSISGFPFSPSWHGGELHGNVNILFSLMFILAHALMMAGFFRHAMRPVQRLEALERWMSIVFPMGTLLLVFTHWGIAWFGGLLGVPGPMVSVGWWFGVAASILMGGMVIIARRGFVFQQKIVSAVGSFLSLQWIYRIFWWIFRSLTRLFGAISQILEGEGGFLWAIVVLILLISIILPRGGG